jgi:hypothetical protein
MRFQPEQMLRAAALFVAFALGVTCLFAQNHSSLVYPGPDGRLVYAGYANEGQSETGNLMIDFSRAGYMGGGVAIPWVPVEITLDPAPGDADDHARIQAAINALSARPLSSAGFRGALLLRAGTYHVSKSLRISAGGIVIRGEGQHPEGTVIRFTATVQSDLFEFFGSGGWTAISSTHRPITDDLVPSGVRSFNVASTAGLAVGDRLMIHRTPNQAWIEAIKMDQLRDLAFANKVSNADEIVNWTPQAYRAQTPRVISAIFGNTITVDAPLVHAIEAQYGGGEIFRYHFNGALRQVGIENIRLESSFTSNTDENHGWSAVVFRQVENGWARRVTARYFGYACIDIRGSSKFITVEDCAQLDPISVITGSRRYSFNISQASFVLMQRCYAREGRHDFVTGSRTRGPNVFADSLGEASYSDIGPHHRYAEGLLFDNIRGRAKPGNAHGGSMNVQNRNWSGTGHGWAGAQTVFWNCDTDRYMIVDAPVGAMNFSIGNIFAEQRQTRWGPVEPDGIWESRNEPVIPRSLYQAQLADRRGHHAVVTVTTASQREGTIWDDLAAWRGDSEPPGLPAFGPLGVDAGPDLEATSESLELHAAIRYPLPRSFPMTIHGWTQLSGPANAVFEQALSQSTTVTFPRPGVYELQFAASQDDNRDPQNVVTHSDSSTLRVTVPAPLVATAPSASADMIVGRRQDNAPNALGYHPNVTNDITGRTGSNPSLTREDRNIVLGYPLPDLPAGTELTRAILHFEVTAQRHNSGDNPGLEVYLLDTAAPAESGTAFFFHGANDPNPAAVRVGGINISEPQGSEVFYPAGSRLQAFTLGGEAFALLKSFYNGDGTPARAAVFFRFNLDQFFSGGGNGDLGGNALDRYRVDVGPAASRLELFGITEGNTFAEWIDGFDLDPELRGPADDPDGDGIPNAVENFFGTHPGEPSEGISIVAAGEGSFAFSHPRNPSPASNLTAAYRWSTNLETWLGDGDTNSDGTTITFSTSTVDDTTTIHAVASGAATDRLFLRIVVDVD